MILTFVNNSPSFSLHWFLFVVSKAVKSFSSGVFLMTMALSFSEHPQAYQHYLAVILLFVYAMKMNMAIVMYVE